MTRTFAAFACLLACSLALADDIPVREFARFAEFGRVKLSPNADYLAATAPSGDQTALAVVRLSDMKITAALRFTRKEHVSGFWWTGPERVVASIATKDGPLAQPRQTGELFAINADGKRQMYLIGGRGRKASQTKGGTLLTHLETYLYGWAWMVDPLPQDPDFMLVQVLHAGSGDHAYKPLFKVNKWSGARHEVLRPPAPFADRVLTDGQGRIRYAAGPDAHQRWHAYIRDVDSGEWSPIDRGDLAGAEIVPLSFSEAEAAAYFISDEGDRDQDCIVRQELATAERRSLKCPAGWAYLAADGSRPIAAGWGHGKPEFKVITPDHPDGRVVAAIANSFPGQALGSLSWSRDGSALVFGIYSDRNPGEYYLYDRKTKQARYLLSLRRGIDPGRMGERRAVSYRAREGHTVRGYLTLPPTPPARPLPLVALPHGGPFGVSADWSWDPEAQLLASRGYAVFEPNFRGSGGQGRRHYEAGKKQWGAGMIDDITDGVRHLVAEGIADPRRICIYGASYGGFAALMSAVREPDLYRCVVAYAGVYDLKRFARTVDFSTHYTGRNYLRDFLGDTDEILVSQSPLTHIGRLKAPVFIAHGEEDRRAPFAQAELLREALEARNHPHEWYVKPDEEHGFYREETRTEFYEKVLAFLDRHIGPGRAP